MQKNTELQNKNRAEEQEKAEADFQTFIEKIKSEAEVLANTNTSELIPPLKEWEEVRLKRQQKNEVTKLIRQKIRLSHEHTKLMEKPGANPPNFL